MKKLAAVLASAMLATAVVPGTAAARTSAENYGEYSLMFEKAASQYYAGGTAAGQWAWAPLSATESDISWGDANAWPPKSAEHFIHDGDWVLLDGSPKA
jgi:hypothetical protein